MAALIDRWIYVFTAVLFITAVLIGFVPDSVTKVGLVAAGKRPPFPLILHLHAVATGSWLVLLLAQTTLMATGRSAGHKQLGLTAMVLAPAVIIIGIILVPTMYHLTWVTVHAVPGGLNAEGQARLDGQANVTLNQLRNGLLFGFSVFMAMRFRKSDLATHKRLMILAPAAPLIAAVARMEWLPTTMPNSPLSLELFALLLIAPVFAWDMYRLRRIQRAYVIWFIAYVLIAALVLLAWNAPWWQAFVPHLMGVAQSGLNLICAFRPR